MVWWTSWWNNSSWREGYIKPYKSPVSSEIYDEFKDKDGRWTGIYVGYLGFIGHKSGLEEKGLKMPQSWNDLLDLTLKKK